MRDFGDFYIIYPDKRWVSAKQIRLWYEDLVADKRIDAVSVKSHNAMAKALDDAGFITLGTSYDP